MPAYNYMCNDGCKHPEHEDVDLIWEEFHGINEEVDIRCPLCDKPASKSFVGMNVVHYFRGNCYLDKAGAKRDADLMRMTEGNDPFGEHRESGEASDLIDRLRKKGKKPPPPKNVIWKEEKEGPAPPKKDEPVLYKKEEEAAETEEESQQAVEEKKKLLADSIMSGWRSKRKRRKKRST